MALATYNPSPPFRIGTGYDNHALVEGRKLIVGGVTIPHRLGLQGHSDADVLLHAIIDSLLGAAALGDLGQHFPDTDPMFAGADSRTLLREVGHRVLQSARRQWLNCRSRRIEKQPLRVRQHPVRLGQARCGNGRAGRQSLPYPECNRPSNKSRYAFGRL